MEEEEDVNQEDEDYHVVKEPRSNIRFKNLAFFSVIQLDNLTQNFK